MIIGGKCQGCFARLDYVLEVADDGAPEIRIPLGAALAFGAGHLCGGCAQAVHVLLRVRREDAAVRAALDRMSADVAEAETSRECPSCGGIDQGNTCCPPERESCAAVENGMTRCDDDHKKRGVACHGCTPEGV